MHELNPRNRSAWKPLLILLGGMALVVLAFLAWIESLASRKMKWMEKQVAALRAETEGHSELRPRYREPLMPGNAWDDYLAAMDALRTVRDWSKVAGFLDAAHPGVPNADLKVFLTTHEPALDLWRQGLRREELRLGINPDRRARCWQQPPIELARMILAQAWLHRNAGDHRKSADLCVDLLYFGRDALASGNFDLYYIWPNYFVASLEELRSLLDADRLSPNDLLELDRQLEVLDRSFPSRDALLREAMRRCGESLLRKVDAGYSGAPMGQAWRYGFSTRLLAARSFEAVLRIYEGERGSCGLPYAEAEALDSLVLREWKGSTTPVHWSPLELLTSRVHRMRLAQLRLLRVAVRLKSTGIVPELADPFGDRLLHSLSGTRFKAWSRGPNGVDDRGQGVFLQHPVPGTPPAASEDVVLEVDR